MLQTFKLTEVTHTQELLQEKFPELLHAVPIQKKMPKAFIFVTVTRFIEDVYAFRFAQDAEKLMLDAEFKNAVSRGG